MEVPLAEIELDLAQSIKRRQIAGGTRKKGAASPKREEESSRRKKEQKDSSRQPENAMGKTVLCDEAAETSQIKDAVTVNS